MNLGEAPEGWALVSDRRYLDAGVAWLAFHFVAVILAGILFSPEPHAFLGHVGLVSTLIILFFILFIVGGVCYQRHADGEQTTFARNYRVNDPMDVYRFIGKRLPRKFYPLNRLSEDHPMVYGYDDETVRKVTLFLREQDGVKHKVELLIKEDRHLVEVKVTTSDRDSMTTQDVLDALDGYFSRHRMEWLSVDVDEDAMLLVAMGANERQNPAWSSSITRDGMEKAMWFVFVVMGVFWLALAWAILNPAPGWVMNLAITGILFKPLLIATFLLVLIELNKRVEQDIEWEHTRTFHASPWYVTAAIQEGLDMAHWSYRTKWRVDPTALLRSECFELGDTPVTIDVAWADKDTDPNWSTVTIRAPTVVEDVASVQDLVRNSVFGRHRGLGLK